MITISDLSQLGNDVTCAQLRYSSQKEFVAIADTLEIMNDFKVRSFVDCEWSFWEKQSFFVEQRSSNGVSWSCSMSVWLKDDLRHSKSTTMDRLRMMFVQLSFRLRQFQLRCDKVLILVSCSFSFSLLRYLFCYWLRFFYLNGASFKNTLPRKPKWMDFAIHAAPSTWTSTTRKEIFTWTCIFLFRSIKI